MGFTSAAALVVIASLGATELAAPPRSTAVSDGQPAEPCAWPTAAFTTGAVGLFGISCSTVLIDPQVMVLYGDCWTGSVWEFIFAEDVVTPPLQEVGVLHDVQSDGTLLDICVRHPSAPVAVCALETPVFDLPVTPIVYGCESGLLEPGRAAAMVGFGPTVDDGESAGGIKRWADTVLTKVEDDELLAFVDGGGATCGNLDIGAPLFVPYPDGSWHVAGIATTASCAGYGSSFLRLDVLVPWIEEALAVDVTPCHDVDGSWSPSAACGDISLAGPEGSGTWDDWCEGTAALERSATCGPAFGASDEERVPVVTIESPADGTVVPSGAAFDIAIAANHAVVDIGIVVEGMEQPVSDASWPYGFAGVVLADGDYTLAAVAHGADGESRESESITIRVGDGAPEPADSSTSSETGDAESSSSGVAGGADTSSGASDSESSDGADAAQSDASGCGCRSTPSSIPRAWAMLALVALARRRRRA